MSNDPSIILGGVSYSIPKLAIRQNRFVEPIAARNVDFFRKVIGDGDRVNLLDVTDAQAEDFTRIVFHTLTRVNPTLTFEQFEEMPISMREIMQALPVCINQSGLFRPVTEAAPPTGEAGTPSTGTTS